jgi:hypothetical protein
MKVFTYYMPTPVWPERNQLDLIDIWKRSWIKRGWEPVVLTEDDAKTHPKFSYYKEKIWALPTEYGHDYEGACFMRWLAVAQAGGGMMTDYDVINYEFLPSDLPPLDKMFIVADNPPAWIFMGAVAGPQQHFQDMADIFTAWVPDEHDMNTTSKTYYGMHCSDLSMLKRMFETKTYPKPDWLTRCPGCSIIGDHPGWKTAKLIHFTANMREFGHWPKTELEKIRPI